MVLIMISFVIEYMKEIIYTAQKIHWKVVCMKCIRRDGPLSRQVGTTVTWLNAYLILEFCNVQNRR